MFKKSSRLNTSEFKEVFDFGKTIKDSFYLIKMKPNNLGFSRYSVVVSKKIAKKAVERNYLKRKFLNAIKDSSIKLPVSDYIFILNSGIKDIQYKNLLNNLKEIKL